MPIAKFATDTFMERPGSPVRAVSFAPRASARRLAPSALRESLRDALDMLMPIEGKSFFTSTVSFQEWEVLSSSLHRYFFFLLREILSSLQRYRTKAFLKTNGISTIRVIRSAAVLASNFNPEKKTDISIFW